MTPAHLRALVWQHTHPDFRDTRADGTRVVLHFVPGLGTCSVPLSSLTEAEMLAKLPRRVREGLS